MLKCDFINVLDECTVVSLVYKFRFNHGGKVNYLCKNRCKVLLSGPLNTL